MDNDNPIVARLHEFGRDTEHEILFEMARELGAKSAIVALIIALCAVCSYAVVKIRKHKRKLIEYTFID